MNTPSGRPTLVTSAPPGPLPRLSAVRITVTGWARSARLSLEARLPILQSRPAILPGALALVGLALSSGLYLAFDVVARLPDRRALSSLEQIPEATLVYDAFGQPAFTFFRHPSKESGLLPSVPRPPSSWAVSFEGCSMPTHREPSRWCGSDPSESPTVATAVTGMSVILGTAAYMFAF